MNKSNIHPKYTIKEGDTIQRITELFCVEEEVWLRYHNNMCRLTNIIRDSIPKGLTEIYLLPELWDKEATFNKVVPQKDNRQQTGIIKWGWENTLNMIPSPIDLQYSVMVAFTYEGKFNSIKYNANIRWISKEEKLHIVEYNKISKTFINELEADLMADELAVKIASVLYPLELVIDPKEGITGINNFSQITERWEKVKSEIEQYYSGEIFEKYIRLNEKALATKEALLRSIQNDWFLQTYFNKIYQTYGSDFRVVNRIRQPLVFDADGVEYEIIQTIGKQLNKDGLINIEMKGQYADERSMTDLENRSSFARDYSDIPATGNYVAAYLVEPQFNTIEKVNVECFLQLTKSKKINIVIARINK